MNRVPIVFEGDSEAELAARASGTIAPDGTDEVARMSRAWRSLADIRRATIRRGESVKGGSSSASTENSVSSSSKRKPSSVASSS